MNKQSKGFILSNPSRVTDRIKVKGFTLIDPSRVTGRIRVNKAFTLIELLVVISIIALLSSVIFASLTKAKVRARDLSRIQTARQIALALEQYEQSTNSYKVANSGLNNQGGGYVAKGAETPGYTNSILSTLKNSGYMASANLKDPVYGTDNYYVGLCTSTNAYNIFVKLEQSQYNNATSSIINTCGGVGAAAEGFSFIASVSGGSSGGGGLDATGTAGYTGVAELTVPAIPVNFVASVGNIDTTFNQGKGAGNIVYASAIQSDGKTIIGGQFVAYNNTAIHGIARLNTDGTLDTSFNVGSGVDSYVRSIAIQSDGKIIIAGLFNTYNGVSRGNIARLNADGSLDASFNPGSGAILIYSVAIQTDGKIIIGGQFTSYNGTGRNFIARINSNGSLDTSFNPGTGANNIVYATSVQSDGKVIIGGDFTTYNSSSTNRIARLNTDGTLDASFNVGTGAASTIKSSSIQTDGKIIIGGYFTSYNGTSRNYIARVNTDGSLDATFNPTTGADSIILATSLQSDGKIIIGGGFTTYNGVARKRIARINSDGSVDTSFTTVASTDSNPIYTLVIQSDGKIVISGQFYTFSNLARNCVTRLNSNGAIDLSFNTGGGFNNYVYITTSQSDGKILVGGGFTLVNNISRNNFARLNNDGTLDTGFDPGSGPDAMIYDAAVQSDGKIIIVGQFATYNGTARSRVARINTDGTVDTSFNPGTGADSTITSVAIQSNGKIVIGGMFTTYNGTTRNRIARINTDGTIDASFNPGSGVNSYMYNMLIQADGKIVIDGNFTSYGGTSMNKIARINTDGTLDSSFSIGSGLNSDVYDAALQPDGKIVIGGDFTTYNGTTRNRIARINTDGSLDTSFNPGSGAGSVIISLALQPDGKIVIGGSTFAYNGASYYYVGRANADGSLDTSFNPGGGPNTLVRSVTVQPDGKIIFGGDFNAFSGYPVDRIVRLI